MINPKGEQDLSRLLMSLNANLDDINKYKNNEYNIFYFLKKLIISRINYSLYRCNFFSNNYRERKRKKYNKHNPFNIKINVNSLKNDIHRYAIENGLNTDKIGNANRVTAIVTSYNHNKFLKERIESILNQTYQLIDIIIVDDCSTDGSQDTIRNYSLNYPDRIKFIFNEKNSGSVFSQWKKGIDLAESDLIWICESDDSCEPDFVETLVKHFCDRSVTLAFGKIQYIDKDGKVRPGLDKYRESAEPGIWRKPLRRPAKAWFARGFGIKNVIPNVGGSIWRKSEISARLWENVLQYKIMGDWYLYLILSGSGQIAYEPESVSYFRIHDNNTSVLAQSDISYFHEYKSIITSIYNRWGSSNIGIKRFIKSCNSVYNGANPGRLEFDNVINRAELSRIERTQYHVMIGILGFSYGGGEIFPIQLANILKKNGILVSILQYNDNNNASEILNMLDPGIPVYTMAHVMKTGVDRFLSDAGVSVFHSHVLHFERKLLSRHKLSVPYMVTLHGSYESIDQSKRQLKTIYNNVDIFCYLTDRNIQPFRLAGIKGLDKFRRFKNGIALPAEVSNLSRELLGIPDDSVVYTLVARGIKGKGWVETVAAFQELVRRIENRRVDLILVGEGDEAKAARHLANHSKNIHFLGFRRDVHDIYRLSDVALCPSRFKGESAPLCLLEAMQVGKPVLATDVGEIRNITSENERNCGIIIVAQEDDAAFVKSLSSAMELLLDDSKRSEWSRLAFTIGQRYDIGTVADAYMDCYRSLIEKTL